MKQEILNGTLCPRHRDAGLWLIEDDHVLELKDDLGVTIAQFSAIGATVTEIIKEADKWLQKQQTR